MSHVGPLEKWLGSKKEEAIYIDFDNNATDFKSKIIEGLALPHVEPLIHYNKTPNWAKDRDFLSVESIEKIKEVYSWEINKFGYVPD
ncbi:hypothetical protein [Alteromonas sp. PRIM-21]|uniref:hypothetical protein n=1 Tax=Alteromonas sp. PRIM-21 TaxID=1454978 RepID=UPI0022B98088|nr:hypothetical protein [Alteromonas sp. PRIM-21]MCZ8531500.1 hypothetical protein [Alteromonas sp. PRIM-21]